MYSRKTTFYKIKGPHWHIQKLLPTLLHITTLLIIASCSSANIDRNQEVEGIVTSDTSDRCSDQLVDQLVCDPDYNPKWAEFGPIGRNSANAQGRGYSWSFDGAAFAKDLADTAAVFTFVGLPCALFVSALGGDGGDDCLEVVDFLLSEKDEHR